MPKSIILYESKYGCTEKIAKIISIVNGPSVFCNIKDFNREYEKFDLFVIGAPVYSDTIDENVIKFIETNASWLQHKKVVLFCTCLETSLENKYFKSVNNILGTNVICLEKALGGKLTLKHLDSVDFNTLKDFSIKSGMDINDMDKSNLNEVIDFALEVKKLKDKMLAAVPEIKIKFYLEEFLESHNTCTLTTSNGMKVRSTPIEYTYKNGCMYFLSEGGEKFANIMLNNNVSISIYDNYQSMIKLAGVQLSGIAEIIDIKEREYKRIIELKGLNYEQIIRLSVPLNIISVKLQKAEFLYSKFKSLGFDSRQVYVFK